MSNARTRSLFLALPLAALLLAACGDDSTDSSGAGDTGYGAAATTTTVVAATPAVTTPDTATSDTATSDTATATGATTLQLASGALGTILVDNEGNTLYLYAKDTPNAPACDAGCLGSWPALVSDGAATVGEGLGLDDVGTVTAADGSTQVTFYGHPLYHFAGDAAPGDANGQGLGGVWFAVDAEGNAVK